MSIVHIKDTKLVRDTHSKAVLNTDRTALNDYYTKKEIAKKQCQDQVETKEKLAQLECEMREIKNLLVEIANLRKK
jgi:uncharacterized protein (UPF0276 family)